MKKQTHEKLCFSCDNTQLRMCIVSRKIEQAYQNFLETVSEGDSKKLLVNRKWYVEINGRGPIITHFTMFLHPASTLARCTVGGRLYMTGVFTSVQLYKPTSATCGHKSLSEFRDFFWRINFRKIMSMYIYTYTCFAEKHWSAWLLYYKLFFQTPLEAR